MAIAVGIDLGASNLRLGIVNEAGELLYSVKEPMNWHQPPSQIVQRLAALATAAPQFSAVSGVGLAIAATVTPEGHIHTEDANFSLPPDFSLPEALSQALDRPVHVDNDANMALWGEVCFGAAQGAKDVLLLTLGTGIGGGLLLDGRLRRGRRGVAGEVGLVQFNHPDGSGFAAVESFASPGALASRLGYPGAHLSDLAVHLNGRVKSLLSEMYDHIALLIINAHLLLDLELVLLSGGFAENGESLQKGVRSAVQHHMPLGMSRPQILLGALPASTAGVIGAAGYWFTMNGQMAHLRPDAVGRNK
ncbi:MAG: ROK family protein [Chloroflexota bacterium]